MVYIGRFLVVGKTTDGKPFVSYRVSSRSFPNRTAVINKENTAISILPNNLEEMLNNPYITYNCIKIIENKKVIVATNGSHTDVIYDKIKLGMPIRDALSLSLLAMDYEKDNYNTPRIAVVLTENCCYMAYVKDNDIRVKEVILKNGIGYYLSVYEHCKISVYHQNMIIKGETPEEICNYIMNYSKFEKPVCCGTAIIDNEIKLATK